MKQKGMWQRKVDDAVAKFTRDVLGIANDAKVPFDYAGNNGNARQEINRVMKINSETVDRLLKK